MYNNKSKSKKVGIIGAGAAGCACAYWLIKSGCDVTIFDKGSPLRTLLPTGGGRCNLAHAEFDFKELAKNYPRGEKFLYSVFSRFSTADTVEMFKEIGIKTYTQADGRIFPLSNSSKDVRSAILGSIKNARFVRKEIISLCDLHEFDNIVIAIGGHSGYELAKEANINIIEPKPSLVGLNTKEDFKKLSGTVVGQILFTHFGISGPEVYKISALKAFDKFPYQLEFNFAPTLVDLQKLLNDSPHKEIKNILREYLPQKFVSFILKDLDETKKACQVDGNFRDLVLDRIHHFKVTVTGTNKGEETVTAGGIDLNDINPKTMEAKKCSNLYCIGEVLNIDGFCGGFNLQNAWSTAYVAAEAILSDK